MAGYRGSKSGANVAHCDGYAWDLKSLLGKGSYGNVYKGWSNGVSRSTGHQDKLYLSLSRINLRLLLKLYVKICLDKIQKLNKI